ncbi:MAG: enoyl-CoA hydratase-related protein [Syntrophomonadaceae bacterium]
MSNNEENHLVGLNIEDMIATVTLNRPPANVLGQNTIEELSKTFDEIEQSVAAVVLITGQGSHSFSAGLDIYELSKNTPEQNQAYFSKVYRCFTKITECSCPVIAAINGFAFGAGLDLAMSADIRVMDEKVLLSATGVNLNLVFCTQRLLRLAGPGRARDMLFRASRVTAQDAIDYGLVQHLAPEGAAMIKAREIAETIITKGPEAVKAVKEVLLRGALLPLGEALDLEAEYVNRMFITDEFERRVRKFIGS